MSLRRALSLLILIALACAPFGRMNMAEAMAMPHAMPAAQTDHCAGQAMPDQDRDAGKRMAADCTIACAAMAPAPAFLLAPPPAAATVRAAAPLFFPAGTRPEADPPPPRFS
jgi:hypothetical protein